MSTQIPDGFDGAGTYYVCPLDPAHIIKRTEPAPEALFNLQVEVREGEDPLKALVRAQIERAIASDEALILMHLELQHSVKEIAVALGTARNSLIEIERALDIGGGLASAEVYRSIRCGLGRE